APPWSSSLTKIAKVRTHLFFRFPGQMGRPSAFRNSQGDTEPRIVELAMLSRVHGTADGVPLDPLNAALDAPRSALAGTAVPGNRELMGTRISASDPAGSQFALQLNMQAAWAGYANVARALCRNLDRCTVMGW